MIAPQSIDSALLLHHPDSRQWGHIVEAMKPGAHLLLFSNVKTHHLGTIAAEDSGLEIRDTIAYVFADGGSDVGMQLVTVARKQLQGTVAENVLRWGTGGINVNDCRIGSEVRFNPPTRKGATVAMGSFSMCNGGGSNVEGRWPANLAHDGSGGVAGLFPANAGASAPVKGTEASMASIGTVTGKRDRVPGAFHSDAGSAARFFYAAPSINNLVAYLLKLTTPPNGTVLTNCDTSNLPNDYTYVTNCEQ